MTSSRNTTVLFTVSLFQLLSLFLLSLITLTKECHAEQISRDNLDTRIEEPYAIGWHLDDGRSNAQKQNWTPELLRLGKRWSTQLRFGKRAFAGPKKQWSSQVRFG